MLKYNMNKNIEININKQMRNGSCSTKSIVVKVVFVKKKLFLGQVDDLSVIDFFCWQDVGQC